MLQHRTPFALTLLFALLVTSDACAEIWVVNGAVNDGSRDSSEMASLPVLSVGPGPPPMIVRSHH